MAMTDLNDDSVPENSIILVHEAVAWDLDGDGNVNRAVGGARIIHVQDVNSDGHLDAIRAADFVQQTWDNNSDGVNDGEYTAWLGVGYTDRNLDGQMDKAVMAYGVTWETQTQSSGFFLASTVEDLDADGNAERVAWVAHSSRSSDTNADGVLESKTEMGAGAEGLDWDDDGVWDRYTGIRIHNVRTGEHSNGWSTEVQTIWILRLWDLDGDGHVDMLHAVSVFNAHWDNNSNGEWDTTYGLGVSYYALDTTGDGAANRQVLARSEIAVSDDDGDDNAEWTSSEILIASVNTSADGTVTHAWVLNYRVIEGNVSPAGVAAYSNTTALAYETWNEAGHQETHAVYVMVEKWDQDRDGVTDQETVHHYEDNRS